MPRAKRTCADCPTIIATGTRCAPCIARHASTLRSTPDARARDLARGTAHQRGYNTAGHQAFRRAVLARDPICVLCRKAWSAVADHHPVSRRDLEAAGLNPNDPQHGRGLCKTCHDRETAIHQPGGWNTPRSTASRNAR